jgi:DNA repair exonuclease SbcCD ATPase subunit
MGEHDTGEVTLTYLELAERLGIGVDSARIKARRMRQHGWHIRPPNGPGGKALVVIPPGALPDVPPEREERLGRALGSDTAKRYDEALVDLRERYDEALGELKASRERIEHLGIEAAEARADARSLREQLDRELARVARLEEELRELRRPWWRRFVGK